jgi:serine phosphatase RsbU (regulator of sigma subunit)
MALEHPARLDVGRLLAAAEAAPPVAAADVVATYLAETVGASEVAFLIADLSGDALIRLSHTGEAAAGGPGGREVRDRVALAGTLHGRVLARQRVEVEESEGQVRVAAPVTNRGEAIGVLELTLSDPPGEQTVADIGVAAHALAYVVIANRRFTDLFTWGQRSVPLSLAAEIQHRLLPGTYTCEAGQFTLAAWLEPAGVVAGDTFDFAVERDTLHLSMTDAMGHSVDAAVLATVLVGALRNARRAGVGLAEQARVANDALAEHAQGNEFATGQLARIDLAAGTATIVNAGHPPPLRLREGRTEPIPLEVDPPFGTEPGRAFRVQELPLEPGDRLLFITDGLLERGAAGADLRSLVSSGAQDHPREAVQHIVRAVDAVTGGELQDDATIMCLDWHGGAPRDRRTVGGGDH